MTPDQALEQLMNAIKRGDREDIINKASRLSLSVISVGESSPTLPHGLPYTAALELLEASRVAKSAMRGKASVLDMLGEVQDSADLDYDAELLEAAIASATPPVEQETD